MTYVGTITSAAVIEGIHLGFTVDFSSIEGIEEIVAELHYSSDFVSVDTILDYHPGCDSPKLNGSALLDVSRIFDSDIQISFFFLLF